MYQFPVKNLINYIRSISSSFTFNYGNKKGKTAMYRYFYRTALGCQRRQEEVVKPDNHKEEQRKKLMLQRLCKIIGQLQG